jgi:23S rRNA U2552 (ribose-2'-O)-methylase RlmE/FtsJ
MLYTQLPNTHIILYRYITCITGFDTTKPKLSPSLCNYLYQIKNRINEHGDAWDNYKKYTNPYEFINTNVPGKNKPVSNHKPLSRSYYKMIELVTFFNLCHYSTSNTFESKSSKILTNVPIKSFHLAEGPGGFIEALSHMRDNRYDTYIGMTILDDKEDYNIPGWKKSQKFLSENKNVFVENGADKTGNILSIDNFQYCYQKYKSSFDIITADGGFDFSSNFNNQELNITKLLYGQICYALCMQKEGGSFILKIFDCYMAHTIDLLYILSAFYKNVYITKPQTSRYANSEKYVVCKNFLFNDCEDFFPILRDTLNTVINTELNIHRFLKTNISNHFINKLEEYNAIAGQQQMETIQTTLSLITNNTKQDRLDSMIKTNILHSIKWCEKHNVEVNIFTSPSTNSFLKFSSSISSDEIII